jgi:uncharacterized coiled-coil protein SlyX
MGGFDRREYIPNRESGSDSRPAFAGLGKLFIAGIGVGLIVLVILGGYKFLKSASTVAQAGANNAQLDQIGQRLDTIEHRLDELEKKRRSATETVTSPPIAPQPSKPQFTFSRPVRAQAAASQSRPAPSAGSSAKSTPTLSPNQQNSQSSQPSDTASSQQQWEATTDRLGGVVGELDSQREAIDRDRSKLDELAERFNEPSSKPFTLQKGADRQQVGPVWLRLQSTDLKNQRYTMRLSLDDKTVELKDRALHEAVQFYASDGKLSFALVVSQISRNGVTGRLVLPQTTATQ